MLSKRSIQETSFAFFVNDMIDEEELQSILEITNEKNPSFPHWKYDIGIEGTLDDTSESETKAEFRFATSELPRLAEALRMPEMFTCCNETTASGLEGLCILFKRFAYPCRLSDLIPRFGRSVPELSLILSEVTEHVFQNNGHLLRDLNQPWLQPRCLEEFANAIHQKGALWIIDGVLWTERQGQSAGRGKNNGSCTTGTRECTRLISSRLFHQMV